MKARESIEEEEQEIKVGKEHSELGIKFMREGEERLGREDAIQASEKLYKAAEEAIKEQGGFMLMRRMYMRKRRGEGDGTLHYCSKEREYWARKSGVTGIVPRRCM